MLHSLRSGLQRAIGYYQRYGWRTFASRLLRVGRWLPRLLKTRGPAPHQRATPEELSALPFGVNVIGFFSGSGSMAEIARLTTAALKAAGVPLAICDITPPDAPQRHQPELTIDSTNPFRFNVLFALPRPDDLSFVHGSDPRSGRYNISFRPWEFAEIPARWRNILPEYDEIWVPSTFVRSSLAPLLPQPVVCTPHPIAQRSSTIGERSPYLASIPTGATIFLFVYNYTRASHGRKNPEAVISAFRRAFSATDNAWLVIKAGFLNDRHVRRELERLASGANVLFIEDWLSAAELDSLMASCDCYVSLHRAEGFGLTIADAMAFGKPVITTSYSGNLDFTTAENSYLVDHKIVPLTRDHGSYKKGWFWAEPDLGHAAAHMRHIYEHPEEAREVGQRARADIQRQLSFEAVGKLMKQRLLEINETLKAKDLG